MSTFGASAPLKELQTKFGFTVENIVATARTQLGLQHGTHMPRHPRDLRDRRAVTDRVRYQLPGRNLGLDLVTEAAALAVGRPARTQ